MDVSEGETDWGGGQRKTGMKETFFALEKRQTDKKKKQKHKF